MNPRKKTLASGLVLLGLGAVAGGWMLWSDWPDPPRRPVPWEPDAIVVLGGGDLARARRAARLAAAFPEAPVLVTGDGGQLEDGLRALGVTEDRFVIEGEATSTWENADLSAPLLEELGAKRVVLVTNWFHVPRSEAVFRKRLPKIEFESAFERAPSPMTRWDRGCQRRERIAAIWYWLRYGVNCF